MCSFSILLATLSALILDLTLTVRLWLTTLTRKESHSDTLLCTFFKGPRINKFEHVPNHLRNGGRGFQKRRFTMLSAYISSLSRSCDQNGEGPNWRGGTIFRGSPNMKKSLVSTHRNSTTRNIYKESCQLRNDFFVRRSKILRPKILM